MSSVVNQVFIQALYYGLVIVLSLVFVGAFQRGFFVTYFKVRTSFGKYVMVKVRSSLRDYFVKGWVDEGFLLYEKKRSWREKDIIRLNIPKDAQVFYRSLAVQWVDVDDEKNAICQTNYGVVSGYDAIKNNNLHVRALTRPVVNSSMDKIFLFLLVIIGIIAIACVVVSVQNYKAIETLQSSIPGMLQNMRGTVIGGGMV